MLGNKQALSDILFSHILKHPLEKTNIYTEAYVVSALGTNFLIENHNS